MANHHGTEGIVKVGTNTVAEVVSFDISERANFAEDTELSDTNRTFNVTAVNEWSGSITCMWDETDTTGQGALVAGASVSLELAPEGAATGDITLSGSALIEEVTTTVNRGEITERSFRFVGNGALTEA